MLVSPVPSVDVPAGQSSQALLVVFAYVLAGQVRVQLVVMLNVPLSQAFEQFIPVNLFSSWYLPCLHSMQESFTRAFPTLQEQGFCGKEDEGDIKDALPT